MKDFAIASVLIVSLIFATTATFFVSSPSFTAPATSKAGHHSSVADQHAKFI